MRWPARPPSDSGLLRRRGAAVLLALVIELLLVLLLLFFVPPLPGRKDGGRTNVFGIEAPKGDDDKAERSKSEKQKKNEHTEQRRAQVRPQTQPPPPVPSPLSTPVPAGPPTYLKLTRNDYQQGDISNVPSHAADKSADASDSAASGGGGGGRGDTPVAGKGRHGETLYAAEWVREPTNGELQPYISQFRARFPGYGEVACRTVARNRVEDCYELGETTGTGFAGSVRQAAFQFLVRAPRVDNKVQVGTWVLIHIDYTQKR